MLTVLQKIMLKSALLRTLSDFYDAEVGVDVFASIDVKAQSEIEKALDLITNIKVEVEEEE